MRTLTGYDQLGMSAAQWGAHFAEATNTPAVDELRQWTAARDLLHRPIEQRQYWRGAGNAAATVQRALVRYKGLETAAIVPSDSTPDGIDSTVTTRKNSAGQTAQTVNADGATLNMAYDAVGNLVRTVDPVGNAIAINYTPGTARFKIGMTDPDQGNWRYTYDTLGQLKTQTDARGKTTTMGYDDLGRMISKSTPSFNARWFYDKTEAGAWCANGLNRLCATKGGNSPPSSDEQRVYDTLGRAYRSVTTLERAYTSEITFDDLGRVLTTRYPTGLTLKYAYSTSSSGRVPGTLEGVTDNANAARVFWRIDSLNAAQVFDAQGHLLKSQLGNGVSTTRSFDPISGKTFALTAGTNATTNAFAQTYTYDKANNLATRTDGITGVVERFAYDVLERMTQYQLSSASDAGAAHSTKMQYNAIGNILVKDDVGSYTYSATTQPHAVRSAGGTNFIYDANGNVTSTSGVQVRTHTWTDFNLPDSMRLGAKRVDFWYDANYKRVKEVTTSGTTVRTLYLIHPDNAGGLAFEREETRLNGVLTRNESRHFINVAGNTVAVIKTLNDAGTVSSDASLTNYWHKDSLGSVVAVSNANGAVLERMAFDAWGRRQRATGRVDPALGMLCISLAVRGGAFAG